MQDRVYIETSVISYLRGRVSTDMIVAAHQRLTNRWWEERSPHYEMVVSELVQQEAAAGDAAAAVDGRAPWDDYRNLLEELALYDPALVEKPRLVVANKMDEPLAETNLVKFKRRVRSTPVLRLAAAFDEGIDRFKETIREAVEKAAVEARAP